MLSKLQIKKVVRNRFKLAEIISIQEMTKGYTNNVYKIKIHWPNKSLILKVSRGKDVTFEVDKEAYIINLIRKNTRIPVSEIYTVDMSKKIIPYNYLLMSELPGEDLDDAWENIPKDQQNELAFTLGEMLAELHTIKFKEGGDLDAHGVYHKVRADFKQISEVKQSAWAKFIYGDVFEAIGSVVSFKEADINFVNQLVMFLTRNRKIALNEKEFVLCHVDYHFKHIRVKEVNGIWKICGLFDFEYALAAPRVYDFIKVERYIFSKYPQLRNSFMNGYGKVSKNHNAALKLYSVGRTAQFYYMLLKAGNTKEATEIKFALEKLL